jgi:hypothetical protein
MMNKLITDFYYGQEMRVMEDGKTVQRVSDGKIITGIYVVRKGKRYRFETTEF